MFTPFIKQEGFNPDSPTNNSPGNPPSPGPFDPSHFFGGTIFPDAFRNSKFDTNPSAIDFDETLASMIADSSPAPPSDVAHPFHSSSNESQQSYDPPPMDLRFPSQRDIHAAPSSFEAVHRTFLRDSFNPPPRQQPSSSAPMDTSAIHNGEVYYDPSSNDYHHFSPSAGISMSRLLTSNLHLGGSSAGRPDTPGSSVASPVDSIFSGGLKKNSPPSPSRSRSRSRLSKSSITGSGSKSRSTRAKRDSITSPPSPPLITPPSSVGSRPNAIVIPNSNIGSAGAHPSSPLGLNIPTHPATAPSWFMPDTGSSYLSGSGQSGFPFGSLPNGQGLALPSPSPTTDAAQKQPYRAAILNEKRRRRRESHNAVERRRRDNINEKISELATLLPEGMLDPGAKEGDVAKVESMFPIGNGMSTGIILADEDGKESPGVKANKGIILRKSVDYIRHLQQLVQVQAQRNRQLEDELKKYRPPGENGMDSPTDDPMAGLLLAHALSDPAMSLQLSPLPGSPPSLSDKILREVTGPDTSPSDRSGGMDDEEDDSLRRRGRERERTGGRFASLVALQRLEDESALSDGDGAAMED